MKYSTLSRLVLAEAHNLRERAAYGGMVHDGGSSALIQKLNDFKQGLIIYLDLRNSEWTDELEVGEPKQFSEIFRKERIRLSNDIPLD